MELVLLFGSGATLPVLALPWLPSSPPVVDMQLPPGSSQHRFLCLPVVLLLHCSGARMSAKDSTPFTHLNACYLSLHWRGTLGFPYIPN